MASVPISVVELPLLRTPLFLIMVYAKAQREDMTPDQKKQVRALAAALKPSSPRKG